MTTETKAPTRAPGDDTSGTGPDTPVAPTRSNPGPVEYVILHGEPLTEKPGAAVVWRVDGEFTVAGRTRKTDVLDAYVGVDDAKPGLWKAVPKSAWAGGISVAEPVMVPKIHRQPLAD